MASGLGYNNLLLRVSSLTLVVEVSSLWGLGCLVVVAAGVAAVFVAGKPGVVGIQPICTYIVVSCERVNYSQKSYVTQRDPSTAVHLHAVLPVAIVQTPPSLLSWGP